MRIALVLSVWVVAGLAVLGFVGLGLSWWVALPILIGMFAVGGVVLCLPEKPHRVFNSENGLLFLASFLGYGLFVAPLFVGKPTLYRNIVGSTILASVALAVTLSGVRFHRMWAVAIGMWAVVLCLWLQMLYRM